MWGIVIRIKEINVSGRKGWKFIKSGWIRFKIGEIDKYEIIDVAVGSKLIRFGGELSVR